MGSRSPGAPASRAPSCSAASGSVEHLQLGHKPVKSTVEAALAPAACTWDRVTEGRWTGEHGMLLS